MKSSTDYVLQIAGCFPRLELIPFHTSDEVFFGGTRSSDISRIKEAGKITVKISDVNNS
jgi:hypothetical protein